MKKKKKSLKIKIILFFAPMFLVPILVGMLLLFIVAGSQSEKDNGSFSELEMEFKLVNVSENVLKWRDTVLKELKKYGQEKYLNLVLAIMMQESGGNVPDVLQASESIGQEPNTITSEEYSIEVGVKYFVSLVNKRDKLGVDLDSMIQSYNYGTGFMDYIQSKKSGKFSTEAAKYFAKTKAAELGWTSYGDPKYVEHVRRYFTMAEVYLDVNNGEFSRPLEDTGYKNKISCRFGQMAGSMSGRKPHRGTDFPYPEGTAVYAAANGTIKEASEHYSWGNNILLESGNIHFRYAHLSRFACKTGDQVKAGELIGYVGSTGYSTGPHLHLEMEIDGKLVDCLNYLP